MGTTVTFVVLGGTGETEFLFSSSACLPDSPYLFTPAHVPARSMQTAKKQPRTTRGSALFYTQSRGL